MFSTNQKIAIARGLNRAIVGARSLAGRSSSVGVRRGGVNWRLDLNEGIDLALYLGVYQHLPKRCAGWIAPGALVVDIGANIGSHSLALARMVGDGGHVIAIEPTDYGFARLKANAALNPDLMPRLIPVQAALVSGEARGVPAAGFHSRWPLTGSEVERAARYRGAIEPASGARFLTLDALLDETRAKHGIKGRVAFIKLDVDGHEIDVLGGAARTLATDAPPMLIEIAPHVQDEVPGRFEAMLAALAAHGYRLEAPRSEKRLPMEAPALRALISGGRSIDAIACAERQRPS